MYSVSVGSANKYGRGRNLCFLDGGERLYASVLRMNRRVGQRLGGMNGASPRPSHQSEWPRLPAMSFSRGGGGGGGGDDGDDGMADTQSVSKWPRVA